MMTNVDMVLTDYLYHKPSTQTKGFTLIIRTSLEHEELQGHSYFFSYLHVYIYQRKYKKDTDVNP